MYVLCMLSLLCLTSWTTGQSCGESFTTSKCRTLGALCECSDLECIPKTIPCGQSTTDMVFVRSFLINVPTGAFASYNVTFLAISGYVGIIEPGAFNGLDRLTTLRINAFSISASSKSWSTDIDLYISYSNGLIGLQAVQEGTLNNLPSMTSLDLSFNKINNINAAIFNDFGSVDEIGLAGNSIEKFDENAFEHVPKLRKLYMSKNRISHLVFTTNSSHGLFNHLETLDLFGNGLSTFPSFILESAPDVINIDLRENPLVCDCNMIDFLKLAGDEQQILGVDPTCKNPINKCSAPKIKSSFTNFDVNIGESMMLAFEVKGDPDPFVSVTGPDGLPRVGRYNIITNQVIVDLYIATENDFGTYTCSAKNSYGSTDLNVAVTSSLPKRVTTISARSKSNSAHHTISQCMLLFLLTTAVYVINYISV